LGKSAIYPPRVDLQKKKKVKGALAYQFSLGEFWNINSWKL